MHSSGLLYTFTIVALKGAIRGFFVVVVVFCLFVFVCLFVCFFTISYLYNSRTERSNSSFCWFFFQSPTFIIVALKGAIWSLFVFCWFFFFFFFFFYNLTAPWTVSNTYAPVALTQSCANLVQHIERLSCATCRWPRGNKGQLSY